MLDGVDRIRTRVGQADHLGIASRSFDEEAGKVAARKRVAHLTKNLAARCNHHIRCVFGQCVAACVVSSNEKPAVATLFDDRLGGSGGECISVVSPVKNSRPAIFVGDTGSSRANHCDKPVFGFGDLNDCQSHRRRRQVNDVVNTIAIKPLSCAIGSRVRLVECVSRKNFNRTAKHLSAKVFHGHVCRQHGAFARQVRKDAGKVRQHANPDRVVA